MIAKVKILGIVAVIAIAIGVSSYLFVNQPSPTENNTVTVRIVYNKLVDSIPFFVAEEKGYFKDAHINVQATAEQDASLITSALLSNQADVGLPVTANDVFLIEAKQPGNLKLFLAGVETPKNSLTMILVSSNSSISSVSDLKGKKVGTLPGSVGDVLPKMIFKNYFDPSLVTLVPLPPQDMINALTAGRIDALWTVEPITNIAINSGAVKPILLSADTTIMNPFPVLGYAFTTKFVNEHPDTAQKIVGIMKNAVDYMNANPNETRSILANYTGFPESVTGVLGWEEYPDASSVQQGYQTFADKMFDMGFLDHKIDTKDIIYQP